MVETPVYRAVRTLTALAIIAVALAGCRATPRFDSPYDFERPLLESSAFDDVVALVGRRAAPQPTLWRRGRVVIQDHVGGQKFWFESTLLYSEPASVRLRGGRVPIGTLFEVGVAGDEAWVYLNREDELYVGDTEELRRQGGVAGAVSLADIVSAILVYQDLHARFDQPYEWRALETRREWLLSHPDQTGHRHTWRLRKEDGLVSERVLWSPSGQALVRVIYDSYRLEDNALPLPGRFRAQVRDGAVEAEFKIDEYKLGRTFAPAVFQAPPASSTLPLRLLGTREAVIPEGAPDEGPRR